MKSESDEFEPGGCGGRDVGTVVGVVGSLEQGFGIDRETNTAVEGTSMGAGKFGACCAIDKDRLADHGRVEAAVTVTIGFADDLRVGAGEPT